MTEIVQYISRTVDVTEIPVIADMDTGYGNALNVIRCVKQYEKSGVAAFHIEDQVAPKKCGHHEGKQLVSPAEMIGKIKAGGARVILCTPTVIGEKKAGANKLDAKLDQYSDLSRSLAKELDLQLIDLRKAFVDHLAANNPEDKEKGILTPDRVHLNEAGNRLVADTMLKTLDP